MYSISVIVLGEIGYAGQGMPNSPLPPAGKTIFEYIYPHIIPSVVFRMLLTGLYAVRVT